MCGLVTNCGFLDLQLAVANVVRYGKVTLLASNFESDRCRWLPLIHPNSTVPYPTSIKNHQKITQQIPSYSPMFQGEILQLPPIVHLQRLPTPPPEKLQVLPRAAQNVCGGIAEAGGAEA